MTGPGRRDLFAGGAGLIAGGAGLAALAGLAGPAMSQERPAATASARDFGAVGDGAADDSEALERTFQAVFAGKRSQVVLIPPGQYRVTRPIRVAVPPGKENYVTNRSGILAHGARIISEADGDEPVISIDNRTLIRYFLIEGLQIQGKGKDKGKENHGISISCHRGYFYNFCMRDMIVEGCGGDGCRLIGNIFEGQIINSYFRDNGRNGATFGHGPEKGILSAIHVFGCVFGGNGRNGAEMVNRATDVGFYGCYFLLNNNFGLSAPTACTLLSHCGFENNHMGAPDFAQGDAGLRLMVGGTLIGCTAYSIYNQTHLVRAYLVNELTMVGCTASGGEGAKGAKLARLEGRPGAMATLIGCRGSVERKGDIGFVELGGRDHGGRFGGEWNGNDLAWLGKHCLWVDGSGQLRIKEGAPENDEDGRVVGT